MQVSVFDKGNNIFLYFEAFKLFKTMTTTLFVDRPNENIKDHDDKITPVFKKAVRQLLIFAPAVQHEPK